MSDTRKKSVENLSNLVKLMNENPELEIVPMVDSEIVASDEHAYWMGRWGAAEIGEYRCADGRVYFKEHDFDELVEDFIDSNYEFYENLSDDELEKLAEKKINNLEWTKAIVVNINSI